MAGKTLDQFDPFADPTPATAPQAGGKEEPTPAPEPVAPPETPESPAAPVESKPGAKARQRASQGRPAVKEAAATVSQPDEPLPPAPEETAEVVAAPAPMGEAEMAMRVHWLNATAGKAAKALGQAQEALTRWHEVAAQAEADGVDEWALGSAWLRVQRATAAIEPLLERD